MADCRVTTNEYYITILPFKPSNSRTTVFELRVFDSEKTPKMGGYGSGRDSHLL
jgi:hypothetical protein